MEKIDEAFSKLEVLENTKVKKAKDVEVKKDQAEAEIQLEMKETKNL